MVATLVLTQFRIILCFLQWCLMHPMLLLEGQCLGMWLVIHRVKNEFFHALILSTLFFIDWLRVIGKFHDNFLLFCGYFWRAVLIANILLFHFTSSLFNWISCCLIVLHDWYFTHTLKFKLKPVYLFMKIG